MGAGDTVAQVLHVTGFGSVAKKAITAVTGRPCRCAGRQKVLNRLLPYRASK